MCSPVDPGICFALTYGPGSARSATCQSRVGTDAFVRPAQPKASGPKLKTLKMSEKTFVLSVV
jgi:hypothetical protein